MSHKTPIDSFLTQDNRHSSRPCDISGCNKLGIYKAPKSPKQLTTYYFFCLEHIQEYNKKWNFYRDMSEEEAYCNRLDDLYGQRPTWPMGQKIKEHDLKLKLQKSLQEAFNFLNLSEQMSQQSQPTIRLSIEQKQALEMLDLKWPTNLNVVKANYKSLAKKYHPDLNPDDKICAEHFKKINQAYQIIKKIFIK